MNSQANIDFEALFKLHYKRLVSVSYAYSQNLSNAEEIVQDVFVDYWKKDRHQNTENPAAYLKQAVIFKTFDYIKKEKRNFEKQGEYIDLQPKESTAASPEAELIDQENLQELQSKIEELPIRTKEIFMMSRFEQKTYNEIAELLSISSKTVEYHLTKALKALKNALFTGLASLITIFF